MEAKINNPIMMDKKEYKVVKLLAKGYTQNEVSQELKKMGYSATSLSTIEKLLAKLRKQYKVKTTIQLFVFLVKEEML